MSQVDESDFKEAWKAIRTQLQNADTGPEIVKGLTQSKKHLENLLRANSRLHSLHSKQLYDLLISKFCVEWLKELGSNNFNALVRPLFGDGCPFEAFRCLYVSATENKRQDFGFHKCILLLEEFVTRELLAQLILKQSDVESKPAYQHRHLSIEDQMLVDSLASLPEKMANRLKHENRDSFLPQNFVPALALATLDVLQRCHSILQSGKDASLLFLSSMVGKLCVVGYSDFLLDTLLPHLCVRVREDLIWCRLCERVLSGIPSRCLEAVLVPLLKKIPWYGLIDKFLGDCVVHNGAVKMLLCTKLLLHRSYSDSRLVLQNIIGYLSSSHTRRNLLTEVSLNLLKVWGDSSSMRHISAQQHVYISKALMICIGCLNDKEKSSYKDELLRFLMPGVQAHLESSDPSVRMLGMCVAKTLTDSVDPYGPKLEFELDMSDHTVIDLLSYKDLPQDPGPSEAEKQVASTASNVEKVADKLTGLTTQEINSVDRAEIASDLDSDDDFEPYDMSNDKKVTTAKTPKYVRDCMEGLINSSEDPDTTEVCLQHAEALVRKKPDGLEQIAAEFTKVLLHLEDNSCYDNFLSNRFSTMVALAVTCPLEVSEYLTSQFYERNYNLRQRMDILEILASSAQELSQPDADKNKELTKTRITELTPNSEPSSWREVVQKRIESNTRRFGKGRSKPEVVPTLNKFTPYAGQFFYPLMSKIDKSGPCLDLLGRDSVLLFRLLYTLAIILHSAKNIPAATHMGRSLLEFTWPLRLHFDSSVRQAVLIATTTVFLVVPAYNFMVDLHTDITETKSWLEDVVEQDPDAECQKMAAQALLLLQDQIKKEVANSVT